MAKSSVIPAIDFLLPSSKHVVGCVCAVYGDDAYLKCEVLKKIRHQILGDKDGEFALSTFSGRDVELREVLDALATGSLFGSGKRLVLVEEADFSKGAASASFISRYRPQLEDYVNHPVAGGVLVLESKSWLKNTRLAKAIAKVGQTIDCGILKPALVKRWLRERAKTIHGVNFEAGAIDVMIDLLPLELGILEQEVARLALLAGNQGTIDERFVHNNVGGWRTRKTWDMIDAAADGHTQLAFEQLHRLLAAGEHPIGLLAQMSSTMRRFGAATRLVEMGEAEGRRVPLRSALQQAGMPPFKLSDAERQLRRIGRPRAKQLGHWLLASDLAMKGHNSAPFRARLELEWLIVRISSAASG